MLWLRVRALDVCPDGTFDWWAEWRHLTQCTVGVLSQTACKLPCVGHPVRGLVSVGLQVQPCQAPGERPRPAGESCCLLLQSPSSLSPWGTMHPFKFFHGLRCVRISLNGDAKPHRRVRNNHSQLVVSYKCMCCFYWRVRWELFFVFDVKTFHALQLSCRLAVLLVFVICWLAPQQSPQGE